MAKKKDSFTNIDWLKAIQQMTKKTAIINVKNAEKNKASNESSKKIKGFS
ncbi:hypothetical protein PP175_26775 (plasmid) [Aneurinibacillus sp. Ricciae_BoGa-3]|nr:hypothetical protein [Aneurinibacillus sp. Ricciae_BoGa-3]WCK57643.1 hypothetical protein PP175_26775 [Aneurinibacillus sp. Ricciae_BoGa-3]